jgi:hypothetical protein
MDGSRVEIPDPDRLNDDEAAAVVDRLHGCAELLVTRLLEAQESQL